MLNWMVCSRTVWLNWIAWNGNIFDNKLCTHAKHNFVWNRTDYLCKMNLVLNNQQRLLCHKIPTNQSTNQPTNPNQAKDEEWW